MPHFEKFQPLFCWTLFQSHSVSPPLWKDLLWFHRSLRFYSFFSSVYFLFVVQIGKFYWSNIKLTDLFFYPLQAAFELFQWVFMFYGVLLALVYSFYFFAETFYFFMCLKHIKIFPLKHFYNGIFTVSCQIVPMSVSSWSCHLLIVFSHPS